MPLGNATYKRSEYMKRLIGLTLSVVLLMPGLLCADNKQKIGELGDKAWEKLIVTYQAGGRFVEMEDGDEVAERMAARIMRDFREYEGKLMRFPKIDFNNFLTDKYNNKYYYYGVKNSDSLFIIKYNNDIFMKMTKLASVFGAEKGTYEVLGTITDAFSWWGNVVLMDIKAFRKAGQICVVINNGEAELIGEDLIQKELDAKAVDPYKDVPRGLKTVPRGLDPLMIARLFYYVGSVEKNREVWLQLIHAKRFYAGRPETSVEIYWENLTGKDRIYYFVRERADSATEDTRVYYFQRQENGRNLGSPVQINIVLDKGEWRVMVATL
jgi:hypothetical protein